MPVSVKCARLAIVLAVCLLIPACVKNKVTKANYEKITVGMTLEDVEKILGKGNKEGDASNVAGQFGVAIPSAAKTPGEFYKWEGGDNTITVSIIGGKVSGKFSTGF